MVMEYGHGSAVGGSARGCLVAGDARRGARAPSAWRAEKAGSGERKVEIVLPTFRSGPAAARDRTQPPLAARVLLEIVERYNDTDSRRVLELLYDDIAAHNDFTWAHRRDADLVQLGCDDGFAGTCGGRCLHGCSLASARQESGLDNAPMYDGVDGPARQQHILGTPGPASWFDFGPLTFNATTGRANFYDVSLSALHAMDSAALARLAARMNRTADAAKFRARHERVARAIRQRLWDNSSGAFTTLISAGPAKGRFYRRWSMTTFYPLLARAATDEQVELMVERFLLNPTKFCVQPPPADPAAVPSNSSTCTFGSSGTTVDDPAFHEQFYLRGRTWAPVSFLTYLGLREYDHVPSARRAARILASQMLALAVKPWRRFRHVAENANPMSGETCDGSGLSDPFYTWGALNAFASVIEADARPFKLFTSGLDHSSKKWAAQTID